MRLSIIIPVYNVKDYVEACIMSCQQQDIPSSAYEIIVLNDGSTDESLEVVQRVSERFDNIRIVSHANKGLSLTRNAGMGMARGEYIWFVDSDDRIEANCLGKLMTEIGDADILAFGCKDYVNGVYKGDFQYSVKNSLVTGPQFILETSSRFMHGAPFYLFRSDFLRKHGFEFCPGIYHEDSEFTPRVLSSALKVAVSNGKYYLRTVRPGSITQSVNPKRAYDLLYVAERLQAHLASLKLTGKKRRAMQFLLPMIINNGLDVMANCQDKDTIDFNRQFSERRLYRCFLKSGNLRYFIEGIALSIFRYNPVRLYRMIKK